MASDPGAFSPHVLNQLQNAAQHASNSQQGRGRGRGRGRAARGQGRGRSLPVQHSQYANSAAAFQPPPPAMDAFPPLGSAVPAAPVPTAAPSHPVHPPTYHPQSRPPNYQRQVNPREFFDRARGDYHPHQRGNRHFPPDLSGHQINMPSRDEFRRPPAPHGNLYQHNAPSFMNNSSAYSSSDHDIRRNVMAQSDYLNDLQLQARARYQLKQEESQSKEDFRKLLESFFQQTLSARYPDITTSEVRLKCYGSLNNGFGLAECDMDLLLALPKGFTLKGKTSMQPDFKDPDAANIASPPSSEPNSTGLASERVEESFELGWLLEDALLDTRIGARLLTNTRVPIMKVCEKPDDTLLQRMRQYSKETRKPPSPTLSGREKSSAQYPPSLDMSAIEVALAGLEKSDSAAQIPLPDHPEKVNASSIEFSGDHGIKCDINFSNFVALVNTRLLKEYCAYDRRVAEVGVFVKTWAKLRDVNTPYWGTLSSYGYVLMVLHYLMNVVVPPVIPNLQYLARDEDAWNEQANTELFEGKYDIRFWSDKDKIDNYKSTAPRNRESTGHLIRGFFWYYSARQGFNYKFDAISIRTKGGILRKQDKGWTEAKWAPENKSVRQRYLLAIEDPFETNHNVARVVGHNGIVAIRDEFRRAWDIIEKIGTPNAGPEDLLEQVENRGDTLRKDQEHHRQKIRQMKEVAEAKEREMREVSLLANGNGQDNGMFHAHDTPNFLAPPIRFDRRRSSDQLLTRDVGILQDKPRQSRYGRQRIVKEDSDDETVDDKEIDDSIAYRMVEGSNKLASKDEFTRTWDEHSHASNEEGVDNLEPFCNPSEILNATGYDRFGKPIPWDRETQSGRWLYWRDRKIRSGQWKNVAQGVMEELHLRLPFDPRRPLGKLPRSTAVPLAPFPLQSTKIETSKAMDCTSEADKKTDPFLSIDPNLRNQTYSDDDNRVCRGDKGLTTVEAFLPPSWPNISKISPLDEFCGESKVALQTIPDRIDESKPVQADDELPQSGDGQAPEFDIDTPTSLNGRHRQEHQLPAHRSESGLSEPVPSPDINSSLPHSAYDSWNVSRNFHQQKLSRHLKAVGLPIPWDRNTRGGQWLLKRDAWLRLGTFRPPLSRKLPYYDLNERFPYNATMTWGRLENLNEELRMFYRTSYYRARDERTQGEMNMSSSPPTSLTDMSESPADVKSRNGGFSRETPRPLYSLPSYRSDLPTQKIIDIGSEIPESTSQTSEEMADSAFIRSRRLAFFAQQEDLSNRTNYNEREGEADIGFMSTANGSNVKDVMKAAGISSDTALPALRGSAVSQASEVASTIVAHRLDEKHRPIWPYYQRAWTVRRSSLQLPQPDGAISRTESSGDQVSESSRIPHPETASSAGTEMDVRESSCDGKASDGQHETYPPHQVHKYQITHESALQVPETLYPDMDNDKRPRDEDPNIMPIPRTYGFEFDIRQLQDLRIIKEGGNGCARDGFQFEVEQEYELGGSGEMALRQSSGKPYPSTANENDVYEYGDGDKEGLLGELPDL